MSNRNDPLDILREQLREQAEAARNHVNYPDVAVMVLKSAVLLEEGLEIVIRKHLLNPDSVLDDQTSFAQKLKLFEAIFEKGEHAKMCCAMRSLKKLRNLFAHELDLRLDQHRPLIANFVNDAESVVSLTSSKNKDLSWQIRNGVMSICISLYKLGQREVSLLESVSGVEDK